MAMTTDTAFQMLAGHKSHATVAHPSANFGTGIEGHGPAVPRTGGTKIFMPKWSKCYGALGIHWFINRYTSCTNQKFHAGRIKTTIPRPR